MTSAATHRSVEDLADVSRETFARLERLEEFVLQWTRKINLISPSSVAEIWQRHIRDSVQIWPHAPGGARSWLDLGSGGGFPGLVLAAIAVDQAPDCVFTLVESDQRKCAFLAAAQRDLSLNLRIIPERIEKLDPQFSDVLTARALAPLPRLLNYAQPHCRPDTICLFPKGQQYRTELTDARTTHKFKIDTIPSVTNPQAVILKISEIHRV